MASWDTSWKHTSVGPDLILIWSPSRWHLPQVCNAVLYNDALGLCHTSSSIPDSSESQLMRSLQQNTTFASALIIHQSLFWSLSFLQGFFFTWPVCWCRYQNRGKLLSASSLKQTVSPLYRLLCPDWIKFASIHKNVFTVDTRMSRGRRDKGYWPNTLCQWLLVRYLTLI